MNRLKKKRRAISTRFNALSTANQIPPARTSYKPNFRRYEFGKGPPEIGSIRSIDLVGIDEDLWVRGAEDNHLWRAMQIGRPGSEVHLLAHYHTFGKHPTQRYVLFGTDWWAKVSNPGMTNMFGSCCLSVDPREALGRYWLNRHDWRLLMEAVKGLL